MNAPRKGAVRAAGIPADVLRALSHGELSSATLAECLALDQATLERTVFPDVPAAVREAIDAACGLGILQRMARIGALLLEALGEDGIAQCRAHGADTVRGWACFMVDAQTLPDLHARLGAIRPLADDAHFGVREWAWMAVRPHLAQELEASIAYLSAWTAEPSERLRRFASEALRPRGVWCSHIAALKADPEQALPVLSPLLCPGRGRQLAGRCRQEPARLGARPVRAVDAGRTGRCHGAHLPARRAQARRIRPYRRGMK
nr:DNA alkylation repair protein [Paracidovorax avenae]